MCCRIRGATGCWPMSIDRRAFLAGGAGLAGLLAAGGFPAAAAAGKGALRVVTLDYAAAATLISMGLTPVGVASSDRWGRWVVSPPLPTSVANIGQDLAVNLEVIAALKPDLITTTPYTDTLRARLERIAPVHLVSVYNGTGTPLANARSETLKLGAVTGLVPESEAFLKEAEAEFGALRDRLSGLKTPPLTLVNFMDDRHVRVYGGQGLYQNVLDRLGLQNAWTRPANYWGFTTVGLEELARSAPADMHLIAFEPILNAIKPTLASSPLWRSMPVVAEGNFVTFPAVLNFGMVPAALRLARLLTTYLEGVSA